jgi:hypothetical protein
MQVQNAQTDTALAPELPQVLTIAEVARALRCSKAHVHHLIQWARLRSHGSSFGGLIVTPLNRQRWRLRPRA